MSDGKERFKKANRAGANSLLGKYNKRSSCEEAGEVQVIVERDENQEDEQLIFSFFRRLEDSIQTEFRLQFTRTPLKQLHCLPTFAVLVKRQPVNMQRTYGLWGAKEHSHFFSLSIVSSPGLRSSTRRPACSLASSEVPLLYEPVRECLDLRKGGLRETTTGHSGLSLYVAVHCLMG